VKIVFTPFQIFGLIKLKKKFPDALFHAHSMYYIFISWLAGLKFIATPMGSDVLVRPEKSFLYRYFTKKSLHFAYGITVDSVRMMEKVRLLSGRDSELVQNGVDVRMISTFENNHIPRSEVVSIRGFYKNYQIDKIFDSRDQSSSHTPITFVYPFHDEIYQMDLQKRMQKFDRDLGRISRDHLYKLLSHTQLVVSIPESDSSPRSVYESIFSGCCVAVSYSDWVASLPSCMRGRTIIVNLDDKDWFVKAVNSAKEITRMPYIPSVEALKNFDQHETMKRVCHEIYHII
jgi:hypothetical protein